jgi:hypothetical protein
MTSGSVGADLRNLVGKSILGSEDELRQLDFNDRLQEQGR